MITLDHWRLPTGARRITTLDAHAAGEPLRIIVDGLPPLEGATILERRRWMRTHHDDVRRALMWEPRGHYDMYGAILTPPVSPSAYCGVLFMHNEGYSTMCGHGVIALVTALVETGTIEAVSSEISVGLDTPAGLVEAVAHLGSDRRVERVTFRNVPSFVLARGIGIDVPGYGALTVDLAFGGAFYAFIDAAQLALRVTPAQRDALVSAASAISSAVSAAIPIVHPLEADLGFLYGTIITDEPEDPAHHSRNICVFAAAEVDRSPTGTGVSARAALHFEKGELAMDQEIAIESILGRESVFTVRPVARGRCGDREGIVPEVGGRGFITGRSEFILDPRDALSTGFLLRTEPVTI